MLLCDTAPVTVYLIAIGGLLGSTYVLQISMLESEYGLRNAQCLVCTGAINHEHLWHLISQLSLQPVLSCACKTRDAWSSLFALLLNVLIVSVIEPGVDESTEDCAYYLMNIVSSTLVASAAVNLNQSGSNAKLHIYLYVDDVAPLVL